MNIEDAIAEAMQRLRLEALSDGIRLREVLHLIVDRRGGGAEHHALVDEIADQTIAHVVARFAQIQIGSVVALH